LTVPWPNERIGAAQQRAGVRHGIRDDRSYGGQQRDVCLDGQAGRCHAAGRFVDTQPAHPDTQRSFTIAVAATVTVFATVTAAAIAMAAATGRTGH
jgi:hypothetical protein